VKIELSVYEDNFSMTVEIPESRQASPQDSAFVGGVVEALGLGPIPRILSTEEGELPVVREVGCYKCTYIGKPSMCGRCGAPNPEEAGRDTGSVAEG
jgi:hypothetical protein